MGGDPILSEARDGATRAKYGGQLCSFPRARMASEKGENMSFDKLFSSDDQAWRTPRHVFDYFDDRFSFDLDAASSAQNALCDRYLTIEDNALEVDWTGLGVRSVWCNPPYGREVGKWVEKCRREADKGIRVCALVFARTDTRWWHDHIMGRARMVYLFRGRVKFGRSDTGEMKHAAPAPSCLVMWYGINIVDTYFKSVTLRK